VRDKNDTMGDDYVRVLLMPSLVEGEIAKGRAPFLASAVLALRSDRGADEPRRHD
jgi:hypothetical protein